MAAQNSIKKSSYANEKQILIAPELAFTIGCQVTNTGLTANDEGKKILKAGTPVKGDLKARNTAFVKEATTPNAILLHDVDVTAGANNGTIVVVGCVDLNRLDADAAELITSTVETALPSIKFIK